MTLQLKIVTSDDEYIEKSRARTLIKPKDILTLRSMKLHLLNKRSNGPIVSNGTKLRSGNNLEKDSSPSPHGPSDKSTV